MDDSQDPYASREEAPTAPANARGIKATARSAACSSNSFDATGRRPARAAEPPPAVGARGRLERSSRARRPGGPASASSRADPQSTISTATASRSRRMPRGWRSAASPRSHTATGWVIRTTSTGRCRRRGRHHANAKSATETGTSPPPAVADRAASWCQATTITCTATSRQASFPRRRSVVALPRHCRVRLSQQVGRLQSVAALVRAARRRYRARCRSPSVGD